MFDKNFVRNYFHSIHIERLETIPRCSRGFSYYNVYLFRRGLFRREEENCRKKPEKTLDK